MFIALRAFKLSGKPIARGAIIETSVLSPQRLQALIATRYVMWSMPNSVESQPKALGRSTKKAGSQ